MSHNHDHNHGVVSLSAVNRAFIVGIVLNTVFTAIEFIMGWYYNSLALISDASHNLSDVASLILSLVGMKLAQKAVNYSYTYGYKKATIIASLVNAILLVIVVIGIFREAFERLNSGIEVQGLSIVVVAAIGVVINAISAFLFFKDQKKDINVKGAFLHLLVDALVSVGVVISGLVMFYTGWNMIDTIISILIAIIIIVTTWGLLKESIRLTIDAVPKGIKFDEVKKTIESVEGVYSVNHIHIWAISSSENSLTAHITMNDKSGKSWFSLKDEIKHELLHHKIQHSTLELDTHEQSIESECFQI